MFELPALERLDGRHALEVCDLRMVGTDIRVLARPVSQ
jgi:hypothetical protein